MSVQEFELVVSGNSTSYKFSCDFNSRDKKKFEKKVAIPEFGEQPFKLLIRANDDFDGIIGAHITVTVLPPDGTDIDYFIKINTKCYEVEDSDIVDRTKVTTKPLKSDYRLEDNDDPGGDVVTICQFQLLFVQRNEFKSASLRNDLKIFLNDSPSVVIVGSDGEVTVSKMLLQIRSSVFKAMFVHDTEESKSSKIELKDFDSKTLQAFCDYLISDQMEQDKTISLGLYLLADKYDVNGLKMEAQTLILCNLEDFDKDQVCDIFHKTNKDFFKQLLDKTYGDKRLKIS